MQSIVTDTGAVIGWFRDPHVVSPEGRDIGFVEAWGLFSYDGSLRGYFENGMFRNKLGKIVARIGIVRDGEPSVDWKRNRVKNPIEALKIIPFFDEASVEGWKEVFAAP